MRTWVVSAGADASGHVAAGKSRGDVTFIGIGGEEVMEFARGADRAIRVALPDAVPPELAVPILREMVSLESGDLVLVPNSAPARALAGGLAAAFHVPLLAGVREVGEDLATVARYGGVTLETYSLETPAVGIFDSEPEAAGELLDLPEIEVIEPDNLLPGAEIIGREEIATSTVDLAHAERIVAAGRGFNAKEDLALAAELASALDASLACSRPIADVEGWMARDQYLGLDGVRVRGELLVTVGISGAIHFTAGVTGAETIVAINDDPDAGIWEVADYGIEGDLYEVLPKLTEEIKKRLA